jgi:glycosyltransferase domain-containing protein
MTSAHSALVQDAHVTAVMCSKNRPEALRNVTERYGAQQLPLVVCDGSQSPLSIMPARGVEYLHLPTRSLWERISEGLARAGTPYAVLAADDDLFAVPTLHFCAQFLDNHPTAVRVCGTTTHVAWNARDLTRSIPDLQVERTLDLKNPCDAVERFREVHTHSPQIFYSVIRTAVAKPVARVLATLPDGAGLLAEYLWTVLPSLGGGTYLLDEPMAVRTIGRNRPDYAIWRSAVAGISRIADWDGWPDAKAQFERLAPQIGVSPDQMAQVIALIEHDNWVFPHLSKLQLESVAGRLIRAAARARYLATPRALFSYCERVVVCGLANRRLARCTSYPWIRTNPFDHAGLP